MGYIQPGCLYSSPIKDYSDCDSADCYGEGLSAGQVRSALCSIFQAIGHSMSVATTQIDFDFGRLLFSKSSASFTYFARKRSSSCVPLPSLVRPVASQVVQIHPVIQEEFTHVSVVAPEPVLTKELVHQAAVRRHYEEMEGQLKHAEKWRASCEESVLSGRAEAGRVRFKLHQAQVGNLRYTESQIAEKRDRKNHANKISQSVFSPFTRQEIVRTPIITPSLLKATLDQQVQSIREANLKAKLEELSFSQKTIANNTHKSIMEKNVENRKRTQLRKSLSESWDKDIALHKINHWINNIDMLPNRARPFLTFPSKTAR